MTTSAPPEPKRRTPQAAPRERPQHPDTALKICRTAIRRAMFTSYLEVYKKRPPGLTG